MKKHKVKFFCFWECNAIGLNIEDGDEMVFMTDIPIEEARVILSDLAKSIAAYDDLEKVCQEHE